MPAPTGGSPAPSRGCAIHSLRRMRTGARRCWRAASPMRPSRSSRIANQKGPHFADPLEGWGEALMAKNQSHLALAKFAEAEKYAPNWGRLHLKWGEALVYAGKKDEAASSSPAPPAST